VIRQLYELVSKAELEDFVAKPTTAIFERCGVLMHFLKLLIRDEIINTGTYLPPTMTTCIDHIVDWSLLSL
jgi:hypothetical protein